MEIGNLIAKLTIDKSEFDKGIKGAQTQLKGFGGKIQANAKTLEKIGAGATLAGGAIVGAFGLATKSSIDFERSMTEVYTLLPNLSADAQKEMSEDLREFNTEMGVTAEKSVPALYQAISAGIPQDNVFEFLKTANMAAVGGVTELETAVDGITSVINAYGTDVVSAAKASDLMFTAVKLGKTNFEELSGSLYNVIPIASSLGVGFEDVTASIAAMTAQGTPTAQATTQIKAVLNELSNSSSATAKTFQELSGQTFAEFIASGGDMQGAFELMKTGADDSGVALADLFSSIEAKGAVMTLTGEAGAEAFATALDEMETSSGATEKAFSTMDESTGRSMEKMMAMFEEIKLEIGDVFLPILKDQILPVIKTLLDQFSEMPDWMKPVIVAIGAMGAALVVLGPLLIALPTAITGISAAFTILSVNPIVLVIAGIIAALIILETKFGLVSKTIEFLSDVFSDFLGWILPATEGAIGGVGDFFTGIFDGIVAAADILFGVLKTMWSWTPLGIVTDNWDAISGFLSGAWDGISSTAGGALSGLAEMFGGAWDGISNTTGDWAGNMSDTFSSAIGTVEGIISPFVQMLPQEYQDMFADIGSAAKSFVSGDFKGAFKSMYDFGKKYTDLVFKQFNSFKKSTVDLFKSLSRSVSDIWNGIYRSIASVVNSITGTINTLIRGMNRLKFDVPDWVPFIGGMEWGFNIPEIPMLAEGGIVTRPTLAMIGEAGPEAVIPLSEFGSQPGGGDININIDSMTVRNDQDIKMIANELYSLVSVKNRARGI